MILLYKIVVELNANLLIVNKIIAKFLTNKFKLRGGGSLIFV